MTLEVESTYILREGEGEALWFSGQLLTYKTTGDQTGGRLAMAEVLAPAGTGSPKQRHHHEDEAGTSSTETSPSSSATGSTAPVLAPSSSARAGSTTGSR